MKAVFAFFMVVLLGACSSKTDLDDVTEAYDLAGAAAAVAVGDEIIFSGASGCALFDQNGDACLRALQPDTKMRVASISKMAVAFAAQDMARDEVIDLDNDVSIYLGFTLRHPDFADEPITLRMLLAHISGIRDPEEYWVAAPGRFEDLLSRENIFGEEAPGYFTYANINYGLAAMAMERAGAQRFDLLMRERVLAPLSLDAGFNWSGVSLDARKEGSALYRREGGQWAVQTDGAETLFDDMPVFLAEQGVDRLAYLATYRPGENPTLFSPQGGVRASALDLLTLLQPLRDDPALAAPVWRYDAEAQNGDAGGETGDDVMAAFGAGVQIVEDDPVTGAGRRAIGHGGEAYGLYSGAWLIRAADNPGVNEDIRIAFAVNGTARPPRRHPGSSFYEFEAEIIRMVLEKAGVSVED